MAIASAAFGKPQDRFGKTGMCLLKSSAMSIKVLSFLPSSVVLKHAWTIHQRKWRSFCLVQRPHYPARPKRFESRGQSENVFCARSPRIRHWCELTERAWENAVQGLAPCLYIVGHLKVIMNVSFIYYNLMAASRAKAIRTICKRVAATPYKNKSPYIR